MNYSRLGFVAVALTVVTGCPDSDDGSGGSGGATSSSSSTSSTSTTSSSTDASTGSSMTMACELTFTDASGSNLGETSFSSMVGQGNAKQNGTDPANYGFACSQNVSGVTSLLNITVSGDAPSKGATYKVGADSFSGVILTVLDASVSMDWQAAPNSPVTVIDVGPGPVSNYTNVTFGLDNVEMQPFSSGEEKAMGTFKVSGQCSGNIQNL